MNSSVGMAMVKRIETRLFQSVKHTSHITSLHKFSDNSTYVGSQILF